MNEIEQWIFQHFADAGAVNGERPEELLDANYFEEELLDSLGTVQMITGLEDEFGVRLEPEHMQDPRFCSMRGLAAIIGELRAGGA